MSVMSRSSGLVRTRGARDSSAVRTKRTVQALKCPRVRNVLKNYTLRTTEQLITRRDPRCALQFQARAQKCENVLSLIPCSEVSCTCARRRLVRALPLYSFKSVTTLLLSAG